MQYAPPYYYAGAGQPSPNGQQPQQPQQQQQQPQMQHPSQLQHPTQMQMPEHQIYPHGMPAYPMAMPHQPHPALAHPGSEFNMLTKPKRKQVKNACVNCQKACKKCDDGRPCQRCIKYGLTETCTNSIRKERKKGVKRGPYKRRNQANGDSASPSSTSTYPTSSASAVATPYQAYGNYDAYGSTNPNGPGVAAYSNPMQQYVMAMQQQQALYQNLPYQQPMATTSSASPLSHPQTSSLPPSAPISAQPSPVITNATTATNTPADSTEPATTPAATSTTTPTTSISSVDNNNNNTPSTDPAAATSGENAKANDDDDGSKLNILSQLCSDVLQDRSPKQEQATMTPPPANVGAPTTVATIVGSPASTQDQQHTPLLSTPVSSSPSSANASPTMYKQETPQVVYPQGQQSQQSTQQGQSQAQQPTQQGQANWQGQW